MAVLVTLSSGDTFYVEGGGIEQVANVLDAQRLVRLGSRIVNGAQVTQLLPVREVPSIHTPEHLED